MTMTPPKARLLQATLSKSLGYRSNAVNLFLSSYCTVFLPVDSSDPLLCKGVVTSALGKHQSTAMQDLLSSFRCNMKSTALFLFSKFRDFLYKAFKPVLGGEPQMFQGAPFKPYNKPLICIT